MREMTIRMQKISRFGVYGVLLQDSKMLLNRKKSGPYEGLWDLPGGGIEFGESPEETLKRELLEESALSINGIDLFHIATAVGSYEKESIPYAFHQVGIIYKVANWTDRSDLAPEEENRWSELKNLKLEELTPFAKQVVSHLEQIRPLANGIISH